MPYKLSSGHAVCYVTTMCAEEFNGLDYWYQTETVLKATFLAERFTATAYVRLYNFGRTYIEVFFDCRSSLIVHFRAFENSDLLAPYLDELIIQF